MRPDKKMREERGRRVSEVFKRFGISPAELVKRTNGRIEDRTISGWIRGGYTDGKGYLSDTKATDLVRELWDNFPLLPAIRLNYLLGIDDYMTDSDWADQYYKIKDMSADTMWAIIEKSLRKQNKHLCFVHRQGQHLDSTERATANCYYTITDNNGRVLKRISSSEMIDFEEKIQEYCDFLTFKSL